MDIKGDIMTTKTMPSRNCCLECYSSSSTIDFKTAKIVTLCINKMIAIEDPCNTTCENFDTEEAT
jgi:hypothetical protein